MCLHQRAARSATSLIASTRRLTIARAARAQLQKPRWKGWVRPTLSDSLLDVFYPIQTICFECSKLESLFCLDSVVATLVAGRAVIGKEFSTGPSASAFLGCATLFSLARLDQRFLGTALLSR